MRCEKCRQISLADLRYARLQQPSFPALKSSAESGCDLCNLSYVALTSRFHEPHVRERLCRGVYPYDETDHDTEITICGLFWDQDPLDKSRFDHRSDDLEVTVGNPHASGKMIFSVTLKVSADPGSPPSRYITGRPTSQNPGDAITMSRVKDWVENCDQNHDECTSSSDTCLPKRILDIEDKPIVREMNGATGRYVALSYCWGRSGKNVLLTREKGPSNAQSTFDEFTSVGIEMDKLAKTVQDAIIVCRNLRIRYLWVDALCIIQNERDLEDFKAEAPKMCEYYQNAYLTLIAGSAQDCADGFLNDRREPKASLCEVVYSRTNVGLLSLDRDMTGVVKLSLPASKEVGHTLTRAWTFQENLLSRRTLNYCCEQVKFSCQTMYSIHEDGDFQRTVSHLTNPPSINNTPISFRDVSSHGDNLEARKYAFELWQSSLPGYTRRDILKPLDKLAAIAGYANLLQKVVRCQYMYGLWKDDLHMGLLWRTSRAWLRPTITRAVDRAPSWSWASINATVFMGFSPHTNSLARSPEHQLLKILSHENVPGSLDPINDNVSAPKCFELNVCGPLRALWPEEDTNGDVKLRTDSIGEQVAIGYWDTFEDYKSNQCLGRPVHALLVIRGRGLLLIQVHRSQYRRIGYFVTTKEEVFRDLKDITLI